MPSDTYILTISEAGVSIPSAHASSHLTGGSDEIPVATTSTSGLMSPTIFDQHVVNTAKISNKTHIGDVTDASGVLTVSKINGVALAPLGTGILRMSSGTPSIATAEQFPTLNQSTTGNANTATTTTNIAGGAVGSIPYQTGSGATTMLSAGTSGYVLKSNGSAAPSWSAVNLSSGTSGTLPVSAGGTGVTTLAAGIVKSNGTSQFQRVDAPTGAIVGTSDTQVLTNKEMGTGTTFSSAIPVQYGGTGVTTLAAGIVKSNGTSNFSRVNAPTGAIVGTDDTQTLTNKTLSTGTVYGSTVPATAGGTGQTSFAVGDLLYAGTTTSVAKLADVATGSVLLSGGIAAAPFYGKVGLTTHVTGTLPVDNGGTGATALTTGYIKSNGTTLTSVATIPATDITGLPSSSVDLTTATGILPVSKGGTGSASGVFLGTALGADPQGNVTGILPFNNGGTGLGALNVPQVIKDNIGTALGTGIPVYIESNGPYEGTFELVPNPLPVQYGGTSQTTIARGQISRMTTFTAISVGSTGTYYPATNGGTLDTTTSSNMTLGAASTFSIRNTSGVTRIFRVYASADATATANDTLGIKLYSGTAGSLTAIDATECRAFTNSATESAKLVTSWMISLSNNQEVALYVANHTEAANITIQRARLIAEAII